MHSQSSADLARIAQDLQIRKVQVESVVQLLDEGHTVPFIARFRKERTGGLPEDLIRRVHSRVLQLRQLADRKQTILKSIEGQGKLSDELREAITTAEHPRRLDDLYLPFKPKRKTPGAAARDKGLEPLAQAIWARDPAVANLDEVLPTLVNPEKELAGPDDVKKGVLDILAELIADLADIRGVLRRIFWDTAKLTTTKKEGLPEGQGLDFKDYFQFSEGVRQIPPHRILAINRGEKEASLQVKLQWDLDLCKRAILDGVGNRPPLLPLADHPHAALMRTAAEDALTRVLVPAQEKEARKELTEEAQQHAVMVFARNLRSLLLQRPLRLRRVLAIDPGFRIGCKLAALDEHGHLLDHAVIHPHPPQNKRDEARGRIADLVQKHQINLIAIGNGTACRETEEVVSDVIGNWNGALLALAKLNAPPPPPPPPPPAEPVAAAPAPEAAPVEAGAAVVEAGATVEAQAPAAPPPEAVVPPPLPVAEPPAPPAEPPPPAVPHPDLAYVIVNEAGASVYATGPVGREEFPDHDASLRSAISIGRRLQDPLAELVKIEPQNIGVGLYQHDVNPKQLKESLEAVVESCVNHVGVDLNAAGVALLRHVSGLNQLIARELVEHRKQHGAFASREQYLNHPAIGPQRFTQSAGFLKVSGSADPLDRTWVHPETYAVARQLLTDLGSGPDALDDPARLEELRGKLAALNLEEAAVRLGVGAPTLADLAKALAHPAKDPRDDLAPPIFKRGILKLEDLKPGMELKGTVLNVVDFGAFVDIGLKDSGLVHISQMANRYIKNPYDVVSVGDVVVVWVMTVDQERRRVSLTMIPPGTERKPPERRAERPPRGERPPRRPDQQGQPPQEGQQQGQRPPRRPPPRQAPVGAGGDRPPPRGDRPPFRGQRPPRPGQGPPQTGDAPAAQGAPQGRAPLPPRPPQRPSRKVPKPKLSQAALEGAAPLRSLGELAAFYEAKQKPPEPAPAAEPPPPPAPPPNEAASKEAVTVPPIPSPVPQGDPAPPT